MKITETIRWLILILVLGGCMTCQVVTLDNQFEEKRIPDSEQKSKGLVHFARPKGKRSIRKIIYEKSSNYKSKNWYSCNNEKLTISQSKHGIRIVFNNVLNGCFGYYFPSTDIQNHPVLAIKAELPSDIRQDVFDLVIGLVDDSRISFLYAYSVYPSHDSRANYYLFNLRDFMLKNEGLNASRIQSITFHINTKGTEPASGGILISYLEFLKFDQ